MKKSPLRDKHILITAGPTWVPLDKVRVITNIFSGNLGIIIAKEAIRKGAKVTLLIGALTECLQSREKILRAFSSGENIMNLVPDFIGLWAQKRVELGIELRGIYVDNKAARAMMDTLPKLYKIVYVSPEKYPSPVDMVIFDNKVGYLIVESSKITSIFIEAKEIGAVMKGVFDLAFEEAKRRGGKFDKEP